jgi:LemA protein
LELNKNKLEKKMAFVFLILGIFLFLILVFAYYYNRIIVLGNRIDNAWAQIDVQLRKRAELVPNLVKIVQSYMKHEQKAIKMVTEARERMLSAKNVEEKAKAGNVLEGALKTIFALAENYPQLRATENFAKLQEELSDIENKIAYTRQFYNDSVLVYNNMITTIPGMWFAGMIGRTQKKPYLETPKEEREPVKVKFDV